MGRTLTSRTVANSGSISYGLLLLRARVNAAIDGRLIRFSGQAFFRGWFSAFTNNRFTRKVLFFGTYITTTFFYFPIRFFRILSGLFRELCLVWGYVYMGVDDGG